MIQAVVFDFDGVLVESVDVKTEAFRKLFLPYGADVSEQVVAYHMAHGGLSRFEKFRYYFANFIRQPLTAKLEKELGERFSHIVLEEVIAAPYVAGAREALEALYRKVPLFVASGTPDDELKLIVARRNMGKYFQGVYGAPEKKGDIVSRILARTGMAPDEMVFVGDAMTDYDAAMEHGVHFIGRRTRAWNSFDGLNVRVVYDLRTLPELLDGFSGTI